MLIEGPLKVAIAEPADGNGKILVIEFQNDFQQLESSQQGSRFKEYLKNLDGDIAALDVNSRDRAGMLIIQQIAEQLMPHIDSGDLALEENITVQIRQEAQVVAVTDLLAREAG